MRVSRWLQNQWYGAFPKVYWLPLECLFRLGVAFRQKMYRDGKWPIYRLPVPVIVVGNISVGGTGKTPLTIWLANFCKEQGLRPGIVSRGYGASAATKSPIAVKPDSDPSKVGDEPVLIARRTGCPVYVSPQRVKAGQALLRENDCTILISDDGLQHYNLARDIEIAVIDGIHGFGNGHCLPAGPLREPPHRLKSVDLVVSSGKTYEENAYTMAYEGKEAVNLFDESQRYPLTYFVGQPVCAMAGIAHPERFFAFLHSVGVEGEVRSFPDHYLFEEKDLTFAGQLPLLMTEKDAVKCRFFARPQHWYVPIQAKLPPAFEETLLTLLKKNYIRDKHNPR